ncbi:major tail protein [Clostridium novyi]
MEKVMPVVDLKKLYIAELKKDNMEEVEFGTPTYYEGIKEIGLKPKMNSDPFFAEGIQWTVEETLEGIEVEVDVVDLTTEQEAFLLGHKLATDGGIIYGANDKAPEVAILFKSLKGNGKARYMVLYKGAFTISDENYKGKEGKANFQSKKLKASFAPLHNNEMWRYKVDEEEGMTDDKFFKTVIVPKPKEGVVILEEHKEK